MLRVIKILKDDFANKVTESVTWEGTDVQELSRLYPPSEIWGADELGHAEIEDGWIRWDYRFEQRNQEGAWVTCDDPRVRIDPELTDREQAIDEENRRLFPGDFLDESDQAFIDYDDMDPDFDSL